MFSALPPPAATDAVLADGTPLLAPGLPLRHPLRRRTDSRDVVDVEAHVVSQAQLQRAVLAYEKVCALAQPGYRCGLVLDERA